jgi:hypothetical protein
VSGHIENSEPSEVDYTSLAVKVAQFSDQLTPADAEKTPQLFTYLAPSLLSSVSPKDTI